MAIKISDNTIIDDSRNLVANTITATSFTGNGASITSIPTDFLQVLAPVNELPVNGATDVSVTPTLRISRFQPTGAGTHANTQFQISTASDFASTVADVFTGANTTVVIPTALTNDSTEHFFRARYFDNNGCCSAFSEPTSFTTENLINTLGESICGGFYMGTICAAGTCYYLIMAPSATGTASCQWRTNQSGSGVGQVLCDGYNATYNCLGGNLDTHPAANFTATRTINGFSDWYLPARNELKQLCVNNVAGCSPAGEGFFTNFPAPYWTSTEQSTSNACTVNFGAGAPAPDAYGNPRKTNSERLRAIRREPF